MPAKKTATTVDPQQNAYDMEVEDTELEGLLEDRLTHAPAAKLYRESNKAIRARLEQHHDDAINADGESGGWVRVGRHRFRAVKTHRKAGEVKIGEGYNFKLEVEAI